MTLFKSYTILLIFHNGNYIRLDMKIRAVEIGYEVKWSH